MDNLLNLFFPPRCLFCKRHGDLICKECLSKFTVLHQQCCLICGKPSSKGFTHDECKTNLTPDQSLSCFEYADYVRESIRFSKYSSKQFMVLKILTELATKYFNKYGLLIFSGVPCWVLCPVPSSERHLRERGFNQAHKIANALSKYYEIPVSEKLLFRHKDTYYQHGMNREDRFKNVCSAFSLTEEALKLSKTCGIIIVDDIWTTGATLLSCSGVFRKAGFQSVICVTLSRKL